jgi:hypothetical protein
MVSGLDCCGHEWPRIKLSGVLKQIKLLARGMRYLTPVEVGFLGDSFGLCAEHILFYAIKLV